MTLIPIKSIFPRFSRLIRDISGELGKEVEFIVEGGETELDKSIIETVSEPITHILRNSLDHGIESNEERLRLGKEEKGKITLKAYNSGTNVLISIKDDGQGIDLEKVRLNAISKGIISSDASLSESEILDLIFDAGFSTAETVTEVSGRGVGMDVVKKKIVGLKGEISIETNINRGTNIILKLPLTLSIIDGLLVKINEDFYIIPLACVDKCFEVSMAEIENNFNQLLILDGEQVPFINLKEDFYTFQDKSKINRVIVVNSESKKIGLCVDSIIGEYQAVLKPLGKYYRNQDFISGATILGDGTIALVLDSNRLINNFEEFNKKEKML